MKVNIPGALKAARGFWKWFEASHFSDYESRHIDYEFKSLTTNRWRRIYRHVYN